MGVVPDDRSSRGTVVPFWPRLPLSATCSRRATLAAYRLNLEGLAVFLGSGEVTPGDQRATGAS